MALRVNELSRLKQWLYAILAADPVVAASVGYHPTLGVRQIFDKIAPEKTRYPCVVFQYMPSADKRGGFGARLYSQGAFLVKAINNGTDGTELWAISDAIDGCLQDRTAMQTPTGLIVMGCTRDIIHDQSTLDEGVQYNELGGRYMTQFYMLGDTVLANQSIITLSGIIADPYNTEWAYYVDTTSAEIALTVFPAAARGGEYLFKNIGTNNAVLNAAAGDDFDGNASITIPPQGSVTIRDYASHKWGKSMVFIPNQATGIEPIVAITATASPAKPIVNTVYKVNPASNSVITIPLATGTGVKMFFEIGSLASFSASFALSGSDTYLGGANPNQAVQTGGTFGLRDIASGIWAIE